MFNPADLIDEYISALFEGSNFGRPGESKLGRKGLMIDCVLKSASGYGNGSTIVRICQDAGLLDKKRKPSKLAIRWAYDELFNNKGKEEMLKWLINY